MGPSSRRWLHQSIHLGVAHSTSHGDAMRAVDEWPLPFLVQVTNDLGEGVIVGVPDAVH